jgi:acetyl-CoA C-acetyltransferase
VALDMTRVPVLVGAAQYTNREQDPRSAPGPFELMETVSMQSASAIAPRIGELSHLWTVFSMSVRHPDPAAKLAEMLGCESAETRCSGMGGSIPQWLVNRACEIVVAGSRPKVLIVGAEALATKKRAKREGVELDWPSAPGFPDTWPPLEADLGVHRVEREHGLVGSAQASAMYALIESAIGHARSEGPADHGPRIARLMESFNTVAAENPYSWFPTRRTAQEILEVTQENRMICFPYPKYMNAVMDVDMSAAVVVTDAATAREWGLAADEVVYITGWADAHDIWYLSQRPAVERSDALSMCCEAALESAASSIDEISAFDLYSCFPSSVEAARDSFGISESDPRPLTLTGGLPYHGGPGSNYVTHSIANAFDWLRRSKGDSVLVHGNGYYLTKHSVGVYSRTEPVKAPFAAADLQGRFDAKASPLPIDESPNGPARVVAYTSTFSRDGAAENAAVLAEIDGRRTVARAQESLTSLLLGTDGVGTEIRLSATPEGNVAAVA